MADFENFNIGSEPNDGTGDSLRSAFSKVGSNFDNIIDWLDVTEETEDSNVLAAVGRGAIVESDTNDNGSYVRWENGEQLAWRSVTVDISQRSQTLGTASADFVDGDAVTSLSLDSGLASGDALPFFSNSIIRFRNNEWQLLSDAEQSFNEESAAVFAWGFWK